jgi:hypothetical protein
MLIHRGKIVHESQEDHSSGGIYTSEDFSSNVESVFLFMYNSTPSGCCGTICYANVKMRERIVYFSFLRFLKISEVPSYVSNPHSDSSPSSIENYDYP